MNLVFSQSIFIHVLQRILNQNFAVYKFFLEKVLFPIVFPLKITLFQNAKNIQIVRLSIRRVLVATQFYGRSLTKGLEYKKSVWVTATHTLYRYLLSLCRKTDAISTL